MNFKKYAGRILTIDEVREGTNSFLKKQKQTRFESKKPYSRTKPEFILAERKSKPESSKQRDDSSTTPSKKKQKADRNEMENRILSQRSGGKGYLQNRQMGKASEKDWDTDIAYIRNVFAYLLVWLNPIRIEAKVRMFAHQNLRNWIHFLWDTMMS